MKEKIGIEKLLELLFEYSRNKSYYWTLRPSGKKEGDVGGTDYTLEDEEVSMVIKSKEFGFIQWLVENDKVKIGITPFEWIDDCDRYEEYEKIIMALSISDTPIDFLCEILK